MTAPSVTEQKFGISFIPSSPPNVFDAKSNKPLGSTVVQRSGNPGYELNSTLLVGTVKEKAVSQKVKFGGFSVFAADN